MKPQVLNHVHHQLSFTVFDVKWVPCSCRFVVVGQLAKGTGVIQIFQLDGGHVNLQKSIEKEESFKCGTFGATTLKDRNFATGNFAGQVQVWDLESDKQPVFSVRGHESIINCIDGVGGLECGYGAPELVTGDREGLVKVWDTRQKEKSVVTLEPNKESKGQDCWTVAFGNSFNDASRSICAGYDNGDIKMFDLRAIKTQWETNVGSGAQNGTIWTIKHLPQDRDVFVTTGGNGSVSLWKYSYPERRREGNEGVVGSITLLSESSISTQPVSAFDWNTDHRGLAVCSAFDQSVRVLVMTKLNDI